MTFSQAKESHPEILDTSAALLDAINLLRAAAPASMSIVDNFPVDLPPIMADSTDLHLIVLNLGINASHALGVKSGVFEVAAEPVVLDREAGEGTLGLAQGQYIRFSFRDNGCGMSEKTMERIFEPFFTTKTPGEGTGLGLAVAYGLATRYRGTITVSSELGKGTVFQVFLPVATEGVAVQERSDRLLQSGNGERVLYIDDDEALVFMMSRMLSRLDFQIFGFTDPSKAMEAFEKAPDDFDVVITDMSMPVLSGPEVVQRVHAIRPDIPVVMVTGFIRPADLELANHLGISELVLKPNTVDEMSAVLHRVISTGGDKDTSGDVVNKSDR